MSDERYTFESTRARLEEILVQVRKKDTSLDQSLEFLEEGVRLANLCNELIDQTSWRPADAGADADDAPNADATDGAGEPDVPPVEAGVEEPAVTESSADDPPEDDERD
jgi:exodeoxyribonuclease VII small subunit